MENQEVLKAIATLADKVSRYHERLLTVEREKEKLEKNPSPAEETGEAVLDDFGLAL